MRDRRSSCLKGSERSTVKLRKSSDSTNNFINFGIIFVYKKLRECCLLSPSFHATSCRQICTSYYMCVVGSDTALVLKS